MGRRFLRTFALALVGMSLYAATDASAGSKKIFTGSLAVQAVATAEIPFTVTASMRNPRVSGRLTASGGTGNDIEVLILSDADFVNWKNGHDARALYQSGRVTVAVVAAELPGPGGYLVVFSNKFSGFTPKTITGALTLAWDDPPPPPPAEQAAAEDEDGAAGGLVVLLGLAALFGAALVLFIVWVVGKRRREK